MLRQGGGVVTGRGEDQADDEDLMKEAAAAGRGEPMRHRRRRVGAPGSVEGCDRQERRYLEASQPGGFPR